MKVNAHLMRFSQLWRTCRIDLFHTFAGELDQILFNRIAFGGKDMNKLAAINQRPNPLMVVAQSGFTNIKGHGFLKREKEKGKR
jgi:hypothetical protein